MPSLTPADSSAARYLDPSLPIEERVNELISSMTLEEKISQMVHDAPAIERLGVPAYNWWNEGLHGVARAGIATVFPQAIGLAATWDLSLMDRIAKAISDEARAKHHEFLRRDVRQIYTGLTSWSPNVNIFRDPRWGRGQETYGEDPYLTASMGVAYVAGIQGDDPRYLKLAATPKHFAAHSGPELDRHHFDAIVDERDLRDTYLPAFQACVNVAKAASVMGAYNRLNGEPCSASATLLTKILREEWGFEGYVVSDCLAIDDIFGGHSVTASPAEAAAMAVNAGCDLECGCAFGALGEALETGLVEEATVDRALQRLFTARFRLGMFDPPEMVSYAQIPYEVNDSAEHRALALQAARESIVLLKNDAVPGSCSPDPLLPLPRDLKSIAVIGPTADSLSVLLGNYCGSPSSSVTPLEGIRRKVAPSTTVLYAQGCEIAPGKPALVAIPSDCLAAPETGASHGLQGAYYKGTRIAGKPAMVRLDPTVDFAWHDEPPLGGFGTDPFSVRWTGTLIPPVSGAYLIGAGGSTGYQLTLDDDRLMAYALNDHEFITQAVPVEMEAGRSYRIVLEYVNTGRDPRVRLLWAPPAEDNGAATYAEAERIARQADVVIMVMGLSPDIEGEELPIQLEGFAGGDRTDIGLPRTQETLLRRIHALGKPVVLVLTGGSALAVEWAQMHVPAILEMWYPGEEGGSAIADVLFGGYNAGGRLPVTFYRSTSDLPAFDDYRMEGRTYRYYRGKPLYPFGFGLSYTTFELADLRLDRAEIAIGEQVTVSLEVSNTGERAGDEVVQLYVKHPDRASPHPIQELKGYERISLDPGERKTVSFRVHTHQLGRYDESSRYVVEPGDIELLVGDSSAHLPLSARVTMVGSPSEVEQVFFSDATVA